MIKNVNKQSCDILLFCTASCCCILLFILYREKRWKFLVIQQVGQELWATAPVHTLKSFVYNGIWNRTHTLSLKFHVLFNIQRIWNNLQLALEIFKFSSKKTPIKSYWSCIQDSALGKIWNIGKNVFKKYGNKIKIRER